MGTLIYNKSISIHIRDQLSRAALSVILNLAEGSGRDSRPDRNRFYGMAKGSVYECVAILDILHDSRKIDSESYDQYNGLAEEIIRILITTTRRNIS